MQPSWDPFWKRSNYIPNCGMQAKMAPTLLSFCRWNEWLTAFRNPYSLTMGSTYHRWSHKENFDSGCQRSCPAGIRNGPSKEHQTSRCRLSQNFQDKRRILESPKEPWIIHMDYESTPEFDAQFLKLTKKNKALEERLLKKISQILDNPSIGSKEIESNFYM